MLTDIQKAIVRIVETEPGIGPSAVANGIGRDKSQTRRAMRDLARRGYLAEQDNGNGYAYFPAGGSSVQSEAQTNVAAGLHVQRVAPQVIEDVPYKDVTPAATSRALTIAPQPFDSRTEEAVRRHAMARMRDGPHGRNVAPPSPFGAALNGLYAADPNGDESLFALAHAVSEHTAALRAAETSNFRSSADLEEKRKAEAAERKAEEKAQREAEELRWAIGAISGRNRLEHDSEPKEPDRGIGHGPDPEISRAIEEPEEEASGPELDIDDLPPIDLATYRVAKTLHARQAENPSYGDTEVLEDDDGRVAVSSKLSPLSLSDLVTFEKIRKAERERGKDRARHTHNHVDNFLAKARSKTEIEARPAASGDKARGARGLDPRVTGRGQGGGSCLT